MNGGGAESIPILILAYLLVCVACGVQFINNSVFSLVNDVGAFLIKLQLAYIEMLRIRTKVTSTLNFVNASHSHCVSHCQS